MHAAVIVDADIWLETQKDLARTLQAQHLFK